MPKDLKGRRALRSRSWSEGERGHTKHARDGDQIQIYLESRPPEDLRIGRLGLGPGSHEAK